MMNESLGRLSVSQENAETRKEEGVNTRWRIDRRIPVALLIAICVQLASALIWATYLEARVSLLEKETSTTPQLSQQYARLEERMDAVREEVGNIRTELQRMTDALLRRR